MKNNRSLFQKIGFLLFFGMMTSGLLISGATAEETGPRIIDGMYISPMYEEIVPIDDGKEIKIVTGWDYLKFWRHKIVSELIGFFDETILYEVIILLSPFISALFGFLVIFRWATTKKKNQSPYREKILAYIKAHPGCTQKQLIAVMETSRGSVCYHLEKLSNDKKIQRRYTSRTPQYYPASDKIENPLEQNLRHLLSLKKSGKVLQTLYAHPASTRKELAGHLSLSAADLRWYLRTFTNKKLLTTAKDGHELRYSLTDEAKQIYELLILTDEPAPQATA